MVIFAPLAELAVAHIIRNLRPADRDELQATIGCLEPALVWAMMAGARGMVATGADDEPIAFIAATPWQPWALRPWQWFFSMMATDRFPEVAWAMTEAAYRLRQDVVAAGGRRGICWSLPEHRVAHRWLRHLGFTLEAVCPDFGANGEQFLQFSWRLSDHVRQPLYVADQAAEDHRPVDAAADALRR